MQLRPDIQLPAVIKALTDTVMPAIDPNNKPALEQLQLSIGLLSIMQQRMALQFRFDCDELERLLVFAAEIKRCSSGKATNSLMQIAAAAAAGSDVLARAKADPDEVLKAVRELRKACGAAVETIYQETPAFRDDLKKVVISITREQLLRDRAWVSMQGWESHPDEVPSIEHLLSRE